ncbi:hypothetical protein [Streptomyces sp. NBC_00120]|uniref:hypothetical protein n=1 Tax=Streptomyces sp. NBC_00120 TaxID=2975660 RepID=UPI002251EA90|nr:hypothetical protein [Streptomyces sp. NBC_00120]MCX5326313.1 hypothetical protein [Streptomyces sp. NBC_00120]
MRANTFPASVIGQLEALERAFRAELARQAALTPEQRRAESREMWLAQQRYEERVAAYNAAADKVNRERGRRFNERQAAKVRAQTCTECFQVPAANGVCGC